MLRRVLQYLYAALFLLSVSVSASEMTYIVSGEAFNLNLRNVYFILAL